MHNFLISQKMQRIGILSLSIFTIGDIYCMQDIIDEQDKSDQSKRESEMLSLPARSLIRETCTTNPQVKGDKGTNSIAYHCAKMEQMLWCVKNAASKSEALKASERIENGNALPGDFEKSISYEKCNSSHEGINWKDQVGGSKFWHVNYHSSELCKAVGATPEQSSNEMAQFLKTLYHLENQKRKKNEAMQSQIAENIAENGMP